MVTINEQYMLYLDESVPLKFDFLVVAGFMIKSDRLVAFEKELVTLMFDNDLISLKNIRDNGVNQELRNEVNTKIANLLKKYDSKIIACITNSKDQKVKFEGRLLVNSQFWNAIKLCMERFYYQIDNGYGLIFYDKTDNYPFMQEVHKGLTSFRKKKIEYLCSVSNFETYRKKIKGIHYLDDKDSLSIQVADLIAGVIQKAVHNIYMKDEKATIISYVEKLDKHFVLLEPYWELFCRNKINKVNGYGIKVW